MVASRHWRYLHHIRHRNDDDPSTAADSSCCKQLDSASAGDIFLYESTIDAGENIVQSTKFVRLHGRHSQTTLLMKMTGRSSYETRSQERCTKHATVAGRYERYDTNGATADFRGTRRREVVLGPTESTSIGSWKNANGQGLYRFVSVHLPPLAS